MPYDPLLAERIRQLLARRRNISERKMFGGVAFLLRANIVVGVWHDSLIARVGPAGYRELLSQPFVGPFDITGKAMSGWLMIGPEGIAADDDLREWVERSLKFVRGLPAKAK